jgi:hypothetical protein
MAAGAKTPIIDAFNQTGKPPADRSEAGMSPTPSDTRGSFVESVDVENGRIDVKFGGDAHQAIHGDTLSITPYMSGTGSYIWRCGTAVAPDGATLLSGGGVESEYQLPEVESRYLPKSCKP